MKYIRTKTGKIYDIINLHVEEKLSGKPYVETSSGWVIYKTSIVKQADTIEELCDEFVVVGAYGCEKPFIFPKEKSFNPLEEIWTHYDNDITCYGAVWTDKGLIYVAKMNDKGELELI